MAPPSTDLEKVTASQKAHLLSGNALGPPSLTSQSRKSDRKKVDGLRRFSTTPFPPEIWSKILSDKSLSLKDIKNVRLSCTMLSGAARAPLSQTFVFKRDRTDIQRLSKNAISQSDFNALDSIRAVRFESGFVSAEVIAKQLTMQLYHQRKRPEDNDGRALSWFEHGSAVEQIHLAKVLRKDWHSRQHSQAIQEYVSWYDRVLRSKQTYDTEALNGLLTLKRLERIHITRMSISFKSSFISEAWRRCDNQNIFSQRTNLELMNLLKVIIRHNKQKKEDEISRWKHITQFSHDELPMNFFGRPERCEQFVRAFKNIQILHLSFDGVKIPPKQFWFDVANCLSSCKKLKDLKLGFDPSFKRSHFDRCYGNPRFASPNPRCPEFNRDQWLYSAYISLWNIFDTNLWPDLEVLRLDGLSVCEDGLKHLLLGNPSIRKLYLCEISLIHGSWQSFLSSIREEMSLDDFEIWGSIMSIHGKDDLGLEERWVFPAPENTWKSSPVEAAPGIREHLISLEGNHRGRDALKKFVLHKEAWPETKLLYGKRLAHKVKPRLPRGQIDKLHAGCTTDSDGNCSPNTWRIDLSLAQILQAQDEIYYAGRWETTPRHQRLQPNLKISRAIMPNWGSGVMYIDGFDVNGLDKFGQSVQEVKTRTSSIAALKNACARETMDEMGLKLEESRRR